MQHVSDHLKGKPAKVASPNRRDVTRPANELISMAVGILSAQHMAANSLTTELKVLLPQLRARADRRENVTVNKEEYPVFCSQPEFLNAPQEAPLA